MESETDPLRKEKDEFNRPDAGRSGVGGDTETEPFPANDPDLGGGRGTLKPPMEDPLEEPTIKPVDENLGTPTDDKTFGGEPAPSAISPRRDTVVARTSSLSEVIAPKRLASRSLPSTARTVSSNNLASKIEGQKKENQKPLRWISAPQPTGHVSL